MHKKEETIKALLAQKLLPLYYQEDIGQCIDILKALYAAGIRLVEFTNRGSMALENFIVLKKLAAQTMEGMQLGIGTIKTAAQAEQYIKAGADFIVAPTINTEVATVVRQAELLWIPGCMTPTEIAQAEEAGATIVKIFPGNILGPGYISAIKELFPSIRFMPTGGVEVEKENLSAWFRAGVVAVGMGSKLISKERIEGGKYDEIRSETEKALQLIKEVS
jgi:2-dehydro-3-deoxyphosphogluconate aldolase/(4S)-4-hydroxy-2-oxoglutarate aldolase